MAATHIQRVEVRAAAILLDRARCEAMRRGMSLSEFMRDAVRRHLEAA